jgi:signal transduction histidine kinase
MNTLSFPEDDGLSRRHLVIEKEGGQWSVRNLASKNGTFVNGTEVKDKHVLQHGDVITASCVAMTYSGPTTGVRTVAFDPPPTEKPEWSGECTSLKEVLSTERADTRLVSEVEKPRVSALWVLVRAGRELAARRPLPELFRATLDLSLEAVGAERGVLLTLDEGDQLVVQASRGGELRISTTVRDRVLREKTSLLVRDVLQDEQLLDSQTILGQGVQSLIAVPLQTEDRVIGLMYVDSLDRRRSFTTDDLNLLTAMANVAGIRIERERWELQRRVLISENVASLGRLAAALSHEFNTPLGALKSAVDTLVLAAARQGSAPPEEQSRLESVQADLKKSLDASLERMEEVISRIQRFTGLDRAEMQSVDVNELLGDVMALAEAPTRGGGVEVELASGTVPPVFCHRQSLSAAFSSLLRYAMEACQQRADGDGRIQLSIGSRGEMVEVRIEDNGGGIPPDELARLFDPGFQIAEGRVSTGNWSLFTARQVIQEQGGEIRVSSEIGKGTTFLVTLPSEMTA